MNTDIGLHPLSQGEAHLDPVEEDGCGCGVVSEEDEKELIYLFFSTPEQATRTRRCAS